MSLEMNLISISFIKKIKALMSFLRFKEKLEKLNILIRNKLHHSEKQRMENFNELSFKRFH